MGDNKTAKHLFDRTSAVAMRIREIAGQAEDIFWEALAKRAPEITSGDFPPDAAAKFSKACHEAAETWFDANMPRRWEYDGRLAEFVGDIPSLPLGWEADWEHPGCIALRWAQGGWDVEIRATPDWEAGYSEPEYISVEVTRTGECVDSADVPWPFAGRTPESYVEAIRSFLEKWAPSRTASVELRVDMRPPRKGEYGWLVEARTAEDALAEVLRESEELGWLADRDYTAAPDDHGMIAITVIVPGRGRK